MSNIYLGKDIRMEDGDIIFANTQDFSISQYDDNLFQAISNRLNTNKPEYTNTEYGSELYKTFGQPKNNLTLNRIRGIVFETLIQEPRIKSINEINVRYDTKTDNKVLIDLTITPINSVVKLNLIFPFFVE